MLLPFPRAERIFCTWTKKFRKIQCSNYHTTLFKVPHHPLQSTTPPSRSSKYHTTLFKVPQHPLQRATPPSSKYHTTIFKVPHHPIQSKTFNPLQIAKNSAILLRARTRVILQYQEYSISQQFVFQKLSNAFPMALSNPTELKLLACYRFVSNW